MILKKATSFFFDISKLEWKKLDEITETLTPQEIGDQLESLGINHCFLWHESGLSGTIYDFNNYSN